MIRFLFKQDVLETDYGTELGILSKYYILDKASGLSGLFTGQYNTEDYYTFTGFIDTITRSVHGLYT